MSSGLRRCLTDRAQAAGDSPAGRHDGQRYLTHTRAQHSASPKAVTARQLQALVRQHAYRCQRVRREIFVRVAYRMLSRRKVRIPARSAAVARESTTYCLLIGPLLK